MAPAVSNVPTLIVVGLLPLGIHEERLLAGKSGAVGRV
jgi:hypothetical protein